MKKVISKKSKTISRSEVPTTNVIEPSQEPHPAGTNVELLIPKQDI